MSKIIVIGASGQIGSDLTLELRNRFGNENVIASDIKNAADDVMSSGPFETLDVMDESGVAAVFKKHNISTVYLLAAMLSGSAEKNPKKAWDLNMKSLLSIVDMAKESLIKIAYHDFIKLSVKVIWKVDYNKAIEELRQLKGAKFEDEIADIIQ